MSTDIDRLLSLSELDHPPVGWVVDSISGDVGPLTLWRGVPLVQWATDALAAAGVIVLDERTEWAHLCEVAAPVVLADIACPGVPPAFIEACVQRCVTDDRPVVGVRPVTDTVKSPAGVTIDRDSVLQVCAPVVVPPGQWDREAPPTDLVAWVGTLRDVVVMEAPAGATRVTDPAALVLLERA